MLLSSTASSARASAAALTTLLLASSISTSIAQLPNAEALNFASYQPVNVTCPSRSLLRSAGTSAGNNQSINADEASYIERRRQSEVASAFETYLANNVTGYDLNALAPNASFWPTVGIAVSGGGFRAALVGAGTFNALDGRNTTATQAGTGGVWQLASYMTGLSGGSWFVSSLAINSNPSIYDLVLGTPQYQGWFLEYNLVLPDGVISIFDNRNYYDNIEANVNLKQDAGFNTSITDAWGVALGYHFGPNGTTSDNFYEQSQTLHNTPTLWSGIKNTTAFTNYSMPFPAIVADSRPPNYYPGSLNLSTVYIPLNSTVYEFNPFEFGSYDPDLAHFIELEYVGTNLFNGQPFNSTGCVNGFDNFGFVIGTSSSLFNAIIQTANATLLGLGDGEGIVETLLDGLLSDIGADLRSSEDDLAIYPNPFYGINEGLFPRADDDGLQLVDGGEAGANIPLDPLLVKARKVDTILAVDGSCDTDLCWPNATSLRASYARAATLPDGQQILPYSPSAETFVNQGLNARPTFFGCNASETEVSDGMPLVVYLPNAPSGGSYNTNVSTYTLEYSREDTGLFLEAMYNVTTRGLSNSTSPRDEQWGACLACAIVERRRQYQNISRSSVCETCFTRYCWDGADTSGMGANAAENPDEVYTDAASTFRGDNKVTVALGLASFVASALWTL
ncbi:hypothetical protein P389DRAFT_156803 [Cystobasidium minutum MCA 4210]|uniref:uncharacterized protein n=1 Tax=Cystobasidium minutum MCA 4210 TaxID=1397322 RepID=UPI0034CD4BF0|eukprot:jgi/Rhomi1/156803/estExt_Genewise1Plus.C_1_t10463